MLLNLALGLAALVYIAVRQLQVRPAKASMRLPVILAVIGAVQLAQFLDQHGHHPGAVFASLAGSLLIAVLFALLRATTVHLWIGGSQVWRQGSLLTLTLWIGSIAAHLSYDYIDDRGDLDGLGPATLLLFLAVTWTIQRLMIATRAARIVAADDDEDDEGANHHVRWP
jgi:hypothetical protein